MDELERNKRGNFFIINNQLNKSDWKEKNNNIMLTYGTKYE